MFKYIFTHSCLILTLEWGVMYGREGRQVGGKEGGKAGGREGRKAGGRQGRKEGRKKGKTCRYYHFYPSALWLAKRKFKEAILLTIVKLEDHGLILAGCKSKLSLTSTTSGFLPRIF